MKIKIQLLFLLTTILLSCAKEETPIDQSLLVNKKWIFTEPGGLNYAMDIMFQKGNWIEFYEDGTFKTPWTIEYQTGKFYSDTATSYWKLENNTIVFLEENLILSADLEKLNLDSSGVVNDNAIIVLENNWHIQSLSENELTIDGMNPLVYSYNSK